MELHAQRHAIVCLGGHGDGPNLCFRLREHPHAGWHVGAPQGVVLGHRDLGAGDAGLGGIGIGG